MRSTTKTAPAEAAEAPEGVPGKVSGIKRLARKGAQANLVGRKVVPARPGDYTAVVCIAVPNASYDKSLPVHQQHESPCTHLFPGDIIEVPTAISPEEAGSLLAMTPPAIRPVTDDDRIQHEIADAEYVDAHRHSERTTYGGIPRKSYEV